MAKRIAQGLPLHGPWFKRFTFIALLLSFPARAQERIDDLLDRGRPLEWLVCGPFRPDVEGGIVAALARGDAPLGDKDYMESIGGTSRMRPRHLLEVTTDDGVAIWQRAGVTGSSIDLLPFFPEAGEGVAFAALYIQVDRAREVFVDLQTSLGARMYLNGFPQRTIRSGDYNSLGVEKFTMTLSAGLNLLLLQIPGASFEALAALDGTAPENVRENFRVRRSLVEGTSGYEFGFRMAPIQRVGEIAVVTRLESPGTFTGILGHLFQDASLTLVNPGTKPSSDVDLEVRIGRTGTPSARHLSSIPPDTSVSVAMSIPLSGESPGDLLRVEITVAVGDTTQTFRMPFTVGTPPQPGTVHAVVGDALTRSGLLSQPNESARHVAGFSREVALLDDEPDYGFLIGSVAYWKQGLTAHPAALASLRRGIKESRVGIHGAYTVPDERIVSGELLVRNLILGRRLAQSVLGSSGATYYAWNGSGLAPQTPQLLNKAGLRGVISNLEDVGLPELFSHEAFDANRILHRHKRMGPLPRSPEDLRKIVSLQRRELADKEFETDVYVVPRLEEGPESYWLRNTEHLSRGLLSVQVSGTGGDQFFEVMADRLDPASGRVPVTGRILTTFSPGSLLSQPEVKQAFGATENLLLSAEKFAAFAGLIGAEYPHDALDFSWRQLLFASTPERLGFSQRPLPYLESLAAIRDAAHTAREILENSLAYLAQQVNSLTGAPINAEGDRPIVVFNPSSSSRTDLVELDFVLPQPAALTIVDQTSNLVPFSIADRRLDAESRTIGRLRFVAKDVPPLGYKTYYLRPEGPLPTPVRKPGVQIENDRFRIILDPEKGGAIISVLDKKRDREYVSGLWNDIVALEEDLDRTEGGSSIWTTGVAERASEKKATFDVEAWDWMERVTVSSPFLDGKLVRTITLYQGVERIDCETRFEGGSISNVLLALTFSGEAEGRAPIYGERFGAVVGRKSHGVLNFQKAGIENPSGTGLQPALRWAAVSPSDAILVGMDMAIPLGPAQVVYGKGPLLRAAAEQVLSAFLARGIPASIAPDQRQPLSLLWTDSTEMPNLNDELFHGAAMRIIIGGPDQNLEAKRLMRQLPEKVRIEFISSLEDGEPLFLYDTDVPPEAPPTPTLLLSGSTDSATASEARAFYDSLVTNGMYQLSPKNYVPEDGPKPAETGLAVFHEGTMLHSLERDGTFVLALSHASEWEGDATPDLELDEDLPVFRYALYPFEGTWRDARVVHHAHDYSEPLLAVLDELHVGSLPSEASFLRPRPEGFIVSAVIPASGESEGPARRGVNPREGLFIRGYEPTGQAWNGTIEFFSGLFEGEEVNLLGEISTALLVRNKALQLRVPGFTVQTLKVTPLSPTRGETRSLLGEAPPTGPTFTRYWRHGLGAAPAGFLPLSLLLEGEIIEGRIISRLIIANNLADQSVTGVATLTPSEGISLSPTEVAYTLGPGQITTTDVLVLHAGSLKLPAGIVARTRFQGEIIQDLIEFGQREPQLKIRMGTNGFVVEVTNRGAVPLEGFLETMTSPRYWPELGASTVGVVEPRRVPLFVSPFGTEVYQFQANTTPKSQWIVIKMAANRNVNYKKIP